MGLFICIVVVLTIVFVILSKVVGKEKLSADMIGGSYFIAVFIASIFSIFSFFVLDKEEMVTTSTKYELVNLNDQSELTGTISGTVFCIRGKLNEKMVYRYYYKKSDGGMKLATVDTNKATIYYLVEDERPYLEIVKNKNARRNFIGEEVVSSSNVSYNFYVPAGSVKEDISLDAA